jgi:hypothetical protein
VVKVNNFMLCLIKMIPTFSSLKTFSAPNTLK